MEKADFSPEAISVPISGNAFPDKQAGVRSGLFLREDSERQKATRKISHLHNPATPSKARRAAIVRTGTKIMPMSAIARRADAARGLIRREDHLLIEHLTLAKTSLHTWLAWRISEAITEAQPETAALIRAQIRTDAHGWPDLLVDADAAQATLASIDPRDIGVEAASDIANAFRAFADNAAMTPSGHNTPRAKDQWRKRLLTVAAEIDRDIWTEDAAGAPPTLTGEAPSSAPRPAADSYSDLIALFPSLWT